MALAHLLETFSNHRPVAVTHALKSCLHLMPKESLICLQATDDVTWHSLGSTCSPPTLAYAPKTPGKFNHKLNTAYSDSTMY